MAMNVRLLRKIAKVIQEKPRKLDMAVLHSNGKGMFRPLTCATAHCICGWGAVLANRPDIDASISSEPVFGIDSGMRNRLFWVGRWPQQFRESYRARKTQAAKARVAAARIEHFIKTAGKE